MDIRSIITSLAVVLLIQSSAPANSFTLTGYDSEQINSDYYASGGLYDNSSVDIVSGGYVGAISAYDNSSVSVNGGNVSSLSAIYEENVSTTPNTSSVTMTDGGIDALFMDDQTSASIFNGTTYYVGLSGSSEMTVKGGNHTSIDVLEYSTINFYGYGWSVNEYDDEMQIVGTELTMLDGYNYGYGNLSGYWADGTAWDTEIFFLEGATINLITVSSNPPQVVPVPAAACLAMVGIGGVGLLRRSRAMS